MGAFRAPITTTNSHRRTSLVIRCNIRLTPIYCWVASRSRIRSPQSDLNLGKPVLTAPGNSDISHPIFPTPLGPPMAYLLTIRRHDELCELSDQVEDRTLINTLLVGLGNQFEKKQS